MNRQSKGGQLARLAGIWCNATTFQAWLFCTFPQQWRTAGQAPARDQAAAVLRMVCDIDSRAQLDNDQAAAARFQRLVRGPYMRHTGAA